MKLGDFRLQLFELTTRASVFLPAAEILTVLNDAADGFRGQLIHEQLVDGEWPPDDPAHVRESDETAGSRG
jgi:hypothetical protein